MAQELSPADFENKSNLVRIAVIALFFGGLLIASIGAGLFFLRSPQSNEIEIISSEAPQAGGQTEVVVYVEGAVNAPGVYKLPTGARVNDAIEKAGGPTSAADLAKINLAAKVSDGAKIHVPTFAEASGGTSSIGGVATGLININSASQAQLESLPAIGPVTAQKIINSRPYASADELLTKKVVSKSAYEKIKDLITIY